MGKKSIEVLYKSALFANPSNFGIQLVQFSWAANQKSAKISRESFKFK